MTRLLLFNLATDADDPALGFAISWIEELARHVKNIDIITMRIGRYELPSHVRVYSVGKEKGYSEFRRVLEFYRRLFRLLRQNRYDGCFAHMMPLFAVMAAPFLRLKKIPIILWYAHKSVTLTLRLATWLVDRVVTASPESFRIRSSNVRVIGHGIDTIRFAPYSETLAPSDDFTVLTVGRLSRIKRIELLLDAVARLRQRQPQLPARVMIVGGAATPDDEVYVRELRQYVEQTGIQDCARFIGSVPYHAIAAWYQQADCCVNLCPSGGMDKAVLEALSCGLIVIAVNRTFREVVGAEWAQTMIVEADPDQLAERLRLFADMPHEKRREIGMQLRERVARHHDVRRLCETLINEFRLFTV